MKIFFMAILLLLCTTQNAFAQETNLITNDETGGEDVLVSEEVEIIPFQDQPINNEIPTLENSIEQVDEDELANIFPKNNTQNINQVGIDNNVEKDNYLWMIGITIAIIPMVIIFVGLMRKYFTKNNY